MLLTMLTNSANSSLNLLEMEKVVIIINSESHGIGKPSRLSPVAERMVTALKQAIPEPITVEVLSAASLWSKTEAQKINRSDSIYCPLTIQLPYWFDFPGKTIYQSCRDIEARRTWVEQKLAYKTSIGDSWLGDLWLPIVLTNRGPLYGEIIGEGAIPNSFQQPIDLTDELRQPLYYLAYQLLESLSAPPSVYLLQFSLSGQEIVFDRLWPFPAAPAIASIKVQQPNLYSCYWQCLTNQPILDLAIVP
jgi:hypothetical protein